MNIYNLILFNLIKLLDFILDGIALDIIYIIFL